MAVAQRGEPATQPLARIGAIGERGNVHIDGGKSAVSDGAADGTGESEARVQRKTGRSSRVDMGSELRLGGVDLGGAGGSGRRSGGHCDMRWTRQQRVEWRGWWC
jgi:hypothetical protein